MHFNFVPQFACPYFMSAQDGLTALHIACRRGLAGMVGVIMTAGRSQHWLLMPYSNEEELVGEAEPADRIIINFKERLTVGDTATSICLN